MPRIQTYAITLVVTVDADECETPDNWDWSEIVDPDHDPHFCVRLESADRTLVDAAHETTLYDEIAARATTASKGGR